MYECFLYGVVRDQEKKILSKPKKYIFEERFWKIEYFVFLYISGEQRDPPWTPPGHI